MIIGASGSGKSVIIKHIMGLFKPTSGEIRVFGENIVGMNDRQLNEVRKHFGLLFQHAALLDWLTVAGNVSFPLKERGGIAKGEIKRNIALSSWNEVMVSTSPNISASLFTSWYCAAPALLAANANSRTFDRIDSPSEFGWTQSCTNLYTRPP